MCSKISILILALIMATVGCGEKKRSNRSGSRTFITDNPELLEKQEFERSLTPEARVEYEFNKAAPLITKGRVKSEMKPYEMPKKFFERLEKTEPRLAVKASAKFKISEPFLDIRSRKNRMTFTGLLKVDGKQDEKIELSCAFDASQVPWTCSEMIPTDTKIAEERRLQATAVCLDTFKCEETGIEIFVVIDGKTESRLYQTKNFSARKAVSGDIEEEAPEVQRVGPQEDTPPVKPVPGKPTPPKEAEPPVQQVKPRDYQPQVLDPKKDPKILEKPAAPRIQNQPQPQQPPAPQTQPAAPQAQAQPMTEEFGPDLSEQELEEAMEDPNQAIEFNAPLPMPSPSKGKYSIPGIETLRPEMGGDVRPQAVGAHNRGILKSGATLEDSAGMMCRQRANRNYGTDMTIELLTEAAKSVNNGQSKIVIANISKQGGGKLCRSPKKCHRSHQTGLDVDIVYPSTRAVSDMWSLCGPDQAECRSGSHISDNFDAERFWKFTKTLTCAKGRPVLAMFVDEQIKRYMCNWVRHNTSEDVTDADSCAYRTLQAMKHSPGHHNHVHVRFKCPGNRDCRDATVSLGRGTGC